MYDTSLQHGFRSFAARNKIHPVSYTHLTLPTKA